MLQVSGNYTRFVGNYLKLQCTAMIWCRPPFYQNQRQLWWRTCDR